VGTIDGMGLFTLSAGASAVQHPIMKGMGHSGCSKRKPRTGKKD